MITRLRLGLLLRFGFPDLWVLWPVTIFRVLRTAFLSSYVLSSFEFWTRPYYERISRDFREVGRWGFVWDEALGVPFGPRLYNNTATYAVYGALSPRAFRLLTLVTYLCSAIGLGLMAGDMGPALAVALLLLGSPAALHSLFGLMLKPEMIWWPVAQIALGAAMLGIWWLALAAGGILLLVNAPVAVLAGILVAPIWLYDAVGEARLPGGLALLFLLPGIAKNAIRVLEARADGFGGAAAAEQRRVIRFHPVAPREIADLALWFVVPLSLAGYSIGTNAALPGAAALTIWLINRRVVKLADNVTMQLVFMTVIVASATVSQNWVSLMGTALFAFYKPFISYPAMRGKREADEFEAISRAPAESRLQFLRETARKFPWFMPVSDPASAPVLKLLNQIPDGSRILLESEGDGRQGSAYLRFRNWVDKTVANRNIEIINHFFLLRLVEPALAERYLDRFSVSTLGVEKMSELCGALGVSYVMAFSTETITALQAAGYIGVTVVQKEQTETLSDLMQMPNSDIALLAVPGPSSLIEPGTRMRNSGKRLSWEAEAGKDYLIRYRFHKDFAATQEGRVIPVEPAAVLHDLPLRFIRLKAERSGEIILEFRTRWWNRRGRR